LSLDDTDTLTYHQNKLKQAQNDHLKLPTLHATMEMTEYLQAVTIFISHDDDARVLSEEERRCRLAIRLKARGLALAAPTYR